MFELAIVAAIIIIYLFVIVMAVISCLCSCICNCLDRTCSCPTYEPYKDKNGNIVYLTHWGDHLEDIYGNRYTDRDNSGCDIF